MNAFLLLELIFYNILSMQRIRMDVYGVQKCANLKVMGMKIQFGESAGILFHLVQKVAKNSANMVAILRSAMEIANALALASIVYHSVLYSVLESAWIEKDDKYFN